MSAEEARWFEEALQAVPEDQRKAFVTIPMDVLCVREPIHVQPQVFRVSFLFARICLVLPWFAQHNPSRRICTLVMHTALQVACQESAPSLWCRSGALMPTTSSMKWLVMPGLKNFQNTSKVLRCLFNLRIGIALTFGMNLQVVRGFQHSKHRKEDTLKSILSIAEWRQQVPQIWRFSHFLHMSSLLLQSQKPLCSPSSDQSSCLACWDVNEMLKMQ